MPKQLLDFALMWGQCENDSKEKEKNLLWTLRYPCESTQTKLATLHFKRGDWCAAYDFLWYEYIEMQTHSPGRPFILLAFSISWCYCKAERQLQTHADLVISRKAKVTCTAVVWDVHSNLWSLLTAGFCFGDWWGAGSLVWCKGLNYLFISCSVSVLFFRF